MFRLAPCVALCCWLASPVAAQDAAPTPQTPPPPRATGPSWIVQVTELRTSVPLDPKKDADGLQAELEQLKKDGKVEMIETIRLSALEGLQAMAQFGRQAAVTTGTAQGMPGRTVRNIQMMQVGTMVRVTAAQQEGKVLLELSYEASRLGEPRNEDTPPDIISVTCNTTLAVSPGQTVLAGGMSSNQSTFLLVSIEP